MSRTLLGRTAAGLLLACTALVVLVRVGREVPGDGAVAGLLTGRPSALARTVDALTGYEAVAGLAGLVVLVLLLRGRRRDAVLCAVSVAGAVLGTTLLKHLVGRPRPEQLSPSVPVSPLSFPSGHAAATTALALALVLVLRGRRGRAAALVGVVVVGVVVVLGAAAAQLVLGLHRASDVLGGWLWAAAWTTAVWAASARDDTR